MDRPDPGLFGPSSATWRLHSDPLLGVAGLRALLLQALRPAAAAGVSEHSLYREDPWGRLARTAEYVGVTTFGTTTQALVAASRVRAVHGTVSGCVPGTEEPYSADDPDLLLWVHVSLVDSVLDVCRRGGVDLPDEEADRYVHEQVRAAALVGVDPEDAPSDVAGLARTVRRYRPALRATPQAREAAAYVLAPPLPTAVAVLTPARPAWASFAGLAFAALPAWARRLYAMPELPGAAGLAERATTAGLRALRRSLRGVQAAVPPPREGPHLRAARQRLGDHPPS